MVIPDIKFLNILCAKIVHIGKYLFTIVYIPYIHLGPLKRGAKISSFVSSISIHLHNRYLNVKKKVKMYSAD